MTSSTEDHRNTEVSIIYINVDHLEKGRYQLHVLVEDKVIKKIDFRK